MHWSSKFVGLPWAERGRGRDGVDCWGLTRLIYSEALGIELPSYAESYAGLAERSEIAGLLAEDSQRWPWATVPPGGEREYDVALFRRAGLAAHVGVVIVGGRMVHAEVRELSRVESYRGGRWERRLMGIYRHADCR